MIVVSGTRWVGACPTQDFLLVPALVLRRRGREREALQGRANLIHLGDLAFDTADFVEIPGPGALRADDVDWSSLEAGLPKAMQVGTQARLHRAADQVLLLGAVCPYLTGRFGEAAAMAAEAAAAGRERHDHVVELWGLLVRTESRLRINIDDPAISRWLEETEQLEPESVPRIEAVRVHVAKARVHLAAGRAADAWRAIEIAAELAGSKPSFVQYTLEGHAGIPEVCLALLEQVEPAGVDLAEVRATAVVGLRRLRHFARSYPIARPRTLTCLGSTRWLEGRHRTARRAWARAAREGERLAMPWDVANAHYELGRHLAVGERSPLGLDRAEHLHRARSTAEALGCRTHWTEADAPGSLFPGVVSP